MSSILDRPCPNCGATDCLQLDNARGEIACENCAVVIAGGLEESESTRFVKDAVFGDIDEEVRGGTGGNVISSKENDMMKDMGKALNSRIVSYLQNLKQKTKSSDSVLHDAMELCRQLSIHNRQENKRTAKPFPTAAACFHFASRRAHVPIPMFELAAVDRTLDTMQCKTQLAELLSALKLKNESDALDAHHMRDAVKLYLFRLRWNLATFEKPVLTVALAVKKSFDELQKNATGIQQSLNAAVSDDQCVLGALCLLRDSSVIQRAMEDRGQISPAQTAVLSYPAESSVLLSEVSSASRLSVDKELRPLIERLRKQQKHIAECIPEAQQQETESTTTATTRDRKRERED